MGHARLVDVNHLKEWPRFLVDANKKGNKSSPSQHPTIFKMSGTGATDAFKDFVMGRDLSIEDNYAEQFAELLLSKDAHLYNANIDVQKASIKETLEHHYSSSEPWKLGSWVYYPWNNELVHVLDKELFNELRTIRNRNLITPNDQRILRDFSIGSVGMSVGSASAISLALSGISEKIKLADGAVLSGSNLNRVTSNISDIGYRKVDNIGRKIYQMNPYSRVGYFTELGDDNIGEFFKGEWPIDLVIDEIDDLKMKIKLRLEAKKRKVPVLMATELADTVMIDVERYDLEPERPLFHGIVKNIEGILDQDLNKREWMKYAVKIIDPNNIPLDMQKSLLKIGTKTVTHPQLGSTVLVTGGVVSFCVKKIALNLGLSSQRTIISPDRELLNSKSGRALKKHTKMLGRAMDSM